MAFALGGMLDAGGVNGGAFLGCSEKLQIFESATNSVPPRWGLGRLLARRRENNGENNRMHEALNFAFIGHH